MYKKATMGASLLAMTASLLVSAAPAGATTYDPSQWNMIPASVQTPKPSIEDIHGVGMWVSPKGKTAEQLATDAAPSYVNWISGFAKGGEVHLGPGKFDWTGFDAIAAAAHATKKPYALMVINSTDLYGLPKWYLNGLPESEIIRDANGAAPAFWSPTANAYLDELRRAIAARYGADPYFKMVRVNIFWRKHGEPWIMGGAKGKAYWLAKWREYTKNPDATFESLQARYQVAELAAFKKMAYIFPARVKLSMATGFAFEDVVDSSPSTWGAPGTHPQRLATWAKVRSLLGERAVFQENGAGASPDGQYDGASGFGEWLQNSFGPEGMHPGAIGAQMVGGVSENLPRMTLDIFKNTLKVEHRRSQFVEVYYKDIQLANKAADHTGAEMRRVLAWHDLSW